MIRPINHSDVERLFDRIADEAVQQAITARDQLHTHFLSQDGQQKLNIPVLVEGVARKALAQSVSRSMQLLTDIVGRNDLPYDQLKGPAISRITNIAHRLANLVDEVNAQLPHLDMNNVRARYLALVDQAVSDFEIGIIDGKPAVPSDSLLQEFLDAAVPENEIDPLRADLALVRPARGDFAQGASLDFGSVADPVEQRIDMGEIVALLAKEEPAPLSELQKQLADALTASKLAEAGLPRTIRRRRDGKEIAVRTGDELERLVEGLQDLLNIAEIAQIASIGHNNPPERIEELAVTPADVEAVIDTALVYRSIVSDPDRNAELVIEGCESVFATFGRRLGRFIVALQGFPADMWEAAAKKSPEWAAKYLVGAACVAIAAEVLAHLK